VVFQKGDLRSLPTAKKSASKNADVAVKKVTATVKAGTGIRDSGFGQRPERQFKVRGQQRAASKLAG
jgi:hypothetical protein